MASAGPETFLQHTSDMADPPTESHALAQGDTVITGSGSTRVEAGGVSLVDLGWHEDVNDIRNPLIEGISNEELWLLVRRFNKSLFHIEETHSMPMGGLDLGIAPAQEFSPNKMRSQLERLYMGAIIGSLGFVKHVSRLRSWREQKRTAVFCAVYFLMWTLDCLTFAILGVVIALIAWPEVRQTMFPPAPLALVDSISGGVTKPNAGILGSADSVTGAPENIKGEAVENESSNFVTALGAIAMNVVMGEDPQGEPNTEEHSLNAPVPDPNKLATIVATAKDKAEGVDRPSLDKSKVPMETIMWSKIPPAMHMLTIISDYWERSANLLNPKPPFDLNRQRRNLAACIVPLAAASIFLSRDFVFRCFTFSFGVGFFGDPLLRATYSYLNFNFPHWGSTLHPSNNLFKGVPTHSQLVLTLLRLGEARKTPLPPPPHMTKAPSKHPITLTSDVLRTTGDDQPLGATDYELEDAVAHDIDMVDEAGGQDAEVTKSNSNKRSKLLGLIKGTAKAGVKFGIGVDKARAKTGRPGAKNRLGVIPDDKRTKIIGPVEFDARFEGTRGYLYLNTSAAVPFLAFNQTSAAARAPDLADPAALLPLWSVAVGDITGLRKHSGYGFKAKLTAGWALDKNLNDSLGITARGGVDWAVTAIPHRDELFNRLIAIGDQKWEVW